MLILDVGLALALAARLLMLDNRAALSRIVRPCGVVHLLRPRSSLRRGPRRHWAACRWRGRRCRRHVLHVCRPMRRKLCVIGRVRCRDVLAASLSARLRIGSGSGAAAAARTRPLRIVLLHGRWVIPSHRHVLRHAGHVGCVRGVRVG
eukprot:359194-Chlamydomonas_euryale.AAC.22